MEFGDVVSIFGWLVILGFLAFFGVCLLIVSGVKDTFATHPRFPSERSFVDEKKNKICFPNLGDPSSVDLSVVVPAYEEQQRLPPMLNECLEYLESRKKSNGGYNYEVIIVDDGSKDGTSRVGSEYAEKYTANKVRVLTLEKNRGKGGAVTLGVLSSRGKYILFADADGATKFADLQKLEDKMSQIVKDPEVDVGIVVGSRSHLEKESIATRSFFRTVLMWGFHFLVWLLCVRSVRDTQCGFKLFTRRSAKDCFSSLHVKRWAFDVELLYIAEKLKIPIFEVAVNWTEIEGSKIVPFWTWLQMGRDLFFIWLKYATGVWRINETLKND